MAVRHYGFPPEVATEYRELLEGMLAEEGCQQVQPELLAGFENLANSMLGTRGNFIGGFVGPVIPGPRWLNRDPFAYFVGLACHNGEVGMICRGLFVGPEFNEPMDAWRPLARSGEASRLDARGAVDFCFNAQRTAQHIGSTAATARGVRQDPPRASRGRNARNVPESSACFKDY